MQIMVQSVELLLDDPTDRAVRAEWTRLLVADLPSQARHRGESNRPHITLAVAARIADDVEDSLAEAAAGALPLPLRLGGLLVFGGGPFVLARAVVPTTALLQLQQRLARAVVAGAGDARADDAGGDTPPTPPPHQAPGAWTAHVTLGRRFHAEQLAAAVRTLSPLPDLATRAVAVRRWDGDRRLEWLL